MSALGLYASASRIDLASLQHFVAVCECGSIGRAARQARIATSAVSKRLSDLEAMVGTPLLQRHSRGVRPTAAGENLLHHARNVLLGLERMRGELGEYAEGVRGHVRICATISAILEFLPQDLGVFAQRHPDIKMDLQERLGKEVLQALQDGVADIGICAVRAGELAHCHLQSQPYQEDRLVLVVPQRHPLAAQDRVAFAAALDFDIVGLHMDSSISRALFQAAAQAGKPLRQRIQVKALDAMCRMIDCGLGVGVLPDRAFALLQGLGKLRAVPLADEWARRELRLVARDFEALPAAARLLAGHLVQVSGGKTA